MYLAKEPPVSSNKMVHSIRPRKLGDTSQGYKYLF